MKSSQRSIAAGVESDCPATRAAWFLARHPWVDGAIHSLWEGPLGDAAARLVAWSLRRRARRTSLRVLVDSVAFDPATATDVESRLLSRLTDGEAARARVVAFLSDLASLRPAIRTGLLRVLVHALGSTFVHREKLRLRDRLRGESGAYPLDATVAIFGRCTLSCRGCYAAGELSGADARFADVDFVLRELRRQHVSHVFLAGKGEPFVDEASRALLFRVARAHPRLFFSVFTNGQSLTVADARALGHLPNVITLVSVDGPREVNDARRGAGTFDKAASAMHRLRAERVLYGFVSTVHKENQMAVLDAGFLRTMRDFGCRFGAYSQFFSADAQVFQAMGLSQVERAEFARGMAAVQASSPLPILDLDGAEAHLGCRARHGATVYIDAITGQVGPCVRDPGSSTECSLYADPRPGRLAEILSSAFFRTYRGGSPHGCPAFARWEPAPTVQVRRADGI